jgi:signal transduction histidine kinase
MAVRGQVSRWISATGAVVGGVGVALLVTVAVRATGAQTVFVFFTGAVALIAWSFGSAAGTAAAVLSTITASTAFTGSPELRARSADVATLLSFMLVGALIAQVTGALRRSRNTARALAREAEDARHAVERARDHAEEANRAKDRFLATMSHELRTPLHAVLAYTDLFQEAILGPVTVQQRNALRRMRTAAEHLAQLVSDVLDVAKSETGGLTVTREPFNVADVCTQALALVEQQARQKNVVIVLEGGARPVMAMGDQKRFRQIVVNLLANAVKFTPSDGRVWLSWFQGDNAAQPCVRVRDSGPGIAPNDHARIFEPFEQVGDLTQRSDGSGLGLTISRRLARAMGGDISVESALGEGAAFTVCVPCDSNHSAPPRNGAGVSAAVTER